MVNPNSKIAISFYTIKSDFNEVLLRVCKKILNSNENFYVNFANADSKTAADKFLWTREKGGFIPHKNFGDQLSIRDKIILYEGSYEDIPMSKNFESLIISPSVIIKKFQSFKKFLIFSYTKDNKFNLQTKEKLKNNFVVNYYDEYKPFKWKQL